MRRGIAQVTAVEDCRAVEQCPLTFGALLHLFEEFAQCSQFRFFDQRQLCELGRILAVMGSIVVDEVDAINVGTSFRSEPHRNNTRRIGLQCEVDNIVPLPAALHELRAAEIVRWRRNIRPSAWGS